MKKKVFSWFLQSKHVFFDFCSSPAAKKWWFQILVASSRCPQNRKNLKIDILPQKYRECSGDAFFFFRKMFWTLESVFLIIFRQPLGAFWRKNKKFYVFLMFFDDFTRSQLFGSVHWPCMGVEGSKKIKIAKNHFKHP